MASPASVPLLPGGSQTAAVSLQLPGLCLDREEEVIAQAGPEARAGGFTHSVVLELGMGMSEAP